MDIAQREQMEALAEKERKQEVATSNKLKFRKREKVCHIFAARLVKFIKSLYGLDSSSGIRNKGQHGDCKPC